jgi:RNA polymerase sigma factor (sigma-70 family)
MADERLAKSTSSGTDMAAAVEAAAGGDEAAFARIVAEYHDDLCRVAYVICQDTEVAHEAVQVAWSTAWRQMRKLREPDRLKSWLVAIAANEARQQMRRQRRRTVVELKVEPHEFKEGSTIWASSVDLRNALNRLNAQDRQLLALRYVAGVDSFELSRMTGLSPSGTRARLQRILGELRSELESGNA